VIERGGTMQRWIIVSGIVGLLLGAVVGNWVSDWWGQRYQTVRLRDMLVVRLNTKTGEMKLFVAKAGAGEIPADVRLVGVRRAFERLVSSSEVKVVTDLSAVRRCDDLGYFGSEENAEEAANRGGDTLYQGQNRAGEERLWLYRCNPN
jgi:hypothetical protein